MAIQAAGSALTASDSAVIQTKDVISSLVMGVINAEITNQSTRTDLDKRTYKAEITLDADINDNTKVTLIIQSDLTKVLLVDVVDALADAGYRISITSIKASRKGVNDRVKLQVAWG